MTQEYMDELSISEHEAVKLVCPYALGSSLKQRNSIHCRAPSCPAWMKDGVNPGFGFCTEFGAGKIAWFCATLAEAIEEALKAFTKGLADAKPDEDVEAPGSIVPG